MHTFQRQVDLPATPDDVYRFHENPHNIRKISPAFLRIVQVEAGETAVAGAPFTLRLRIFGTPLTWRGKWTAAERPGLLIDEAALFPFQKWHHEHRFEPIFGGTRMTDSVHYALPFGWFGKLLGTTVLRLQLHLMFVSRHRATLRYFSLP